MERIEACVGYKLDEFQRNALQVIESGDDLLVTAPTASGKTTVLLTAVILQAFDKGKNAIVTTPIKALSNQMYNTCNVWLTTVGHPHRISLLTGDIQSRCTQKGGDGQPQLLIMTSEILANKLDTIRNGGTDDDLNDVSVLVIDETHYINDTDRGHVWERTIMNLPTSIQLVALSATLSDPEKFCEWLSRRKPTHLVTRVDRHVPLHVGGYDKKGQFIELFSTKDKRSFESKTLTQLAIPSGTFTQNITKLITLLQKTDKLPAIVFCLSKKKCVQAASCIDTNLLYGSAPVHDKDMDPDTYAYHKEEHQWKVARIREQQDRLYRRYLGPYRSILETLPGFETWKTLLDKGIGYHHAGMIPILREYTELLFSEKLIQVVVATETLAVGINMPARTTVFTQVEKPTSKDQMVMLKPDQFWQMAGRAGRRGMDEKGFVVYYPMERVTAHESDLRTMMFDRMPPVTSQLHITPFFVLKHYGTTDFLEKSLLSYQSNNMITVMESTLESLPCVDDKTIASVKRYMELQTRLHGDGFIKLTPAQRKTCEKEIVSLCVTKEEIETVVKRLDLERDIGFYKQDGTDQWTMGETWLVEHGFVANGTHTRKGLITSGLTDGEPLLRGTIISSSILHHRSFHDIVGWLGCFTEEIRPQISISLEATSLYEIMDEMEALQTNETIHYDTGMLLYIWSTTKDIKKISSYIDFSHLGVFIKAVLRVISFIEELKPILLGIQHYELYNCLENHHEQLLDGIVTNRSLYTSM